MKNRWVATLVFAPTIVAFVVLLAGMYWLPHQRVLGASDWYFAPIVLLYLFYLSLIAVPFLFVQAGRSRERGEKGWVWMHTMIVIIESVAVWMALECWDGWFLLPMIAFIGASVWALASAWKKKADTFYRNFLIVFIGLIIVAFLVALSMVFFGRWCIVE